MSTERDRKRAYRVAGSVLGRHWAEVADECRGEPGTLAEVARIHDGLRAASLVPLSPTADDPTQPSGPPDFARAEEDEGSAVPALGGQAQLEPDAGKASGQGAGAGGGDDQPPPDSVSLHGVSCDEVAAWLDTEAPNLPESILMADRWAKFRQFQDHLHDCPACQTVAAIRRIEREGT